jgi:hypothetical protein
VKDQTWYKCVSYFKDRVKYSPSQKWFRQTESDVNDTPVQVRYLQYGVPLTHNKDEVERDGGVLSVSNSPSTL